MTNVAAASELLKPFDARLRRCYTVSTRINSVVNDDEECSATESVCARRPKRGPKAIWALSPARLRK